jgi:hypothetical protein
MKKVLMTIVSTFIIIGFSACGGGGGGDDASFENSESKIPIDVNCTTTPTSAQISNYIPLQSGDNIVKEVTDTEISIYHDVDGNKKVCLVSGSAYIIRK